MKPIQAVAAALVLAVIVIAAAAAGFGAAALAERFDANPFAPHGDERGPWKPARLIFEPRDGFSRYGQLWQTQTNARHEYRFVRLTELEPEPLYPGKFPSGSAPVGSNPVGSNPVGSAAPRGAGSMKRSGLCLIVTLIVLAGIALAALKYLHR